MKYFKVFNFTLFVLNPFLSFLSTFRDILKGRDSCFIFSLSISLILIYFPLMWDTSANFFESYYLSQYNNSLSFLNLYNDIPAYLMREFGIDFFFFIFVTTFFIIYTWSKITYKYFEKLEINYKYVFLSIFLIFTFNYRDLMDIHRNTLSYSFFFYFLFLVKNRKLVYFLFFSLCAVLFHSSSLILIFLYILSLLKLSYRMNAILLIFCFVFGVFLPSLITLFKSFITNIPVYGPALNFYIYGENFGIQIFSTGTLLKKILNCFIIVFGCFCLLNTSRYLGKERIIQFCIYLGCLALLFSGFVTFFERFNLAFNFLIIYIFLVTRNYSFKCILAFLVLLRSLVLYSFIYFPIFFFDHSDVLKSTDVKNQLILKPFFYPTPFLLNIKDHGYSDELISKYSIWGK